MKSLLKKRLGGGVAQAVAGQAVNYAARQHVGENKAIDVKLGAALLKDRRVAVPTKLMALGLGIIAVMVINAFELPLETILAVLLPGFGLAINFAVSGLEFAVGSFVLAAVAIPHLAPKTLVDRIRSERNPVPIPVMVEARR